MSGQLLIHLSEWTVLLVACLGLVAVMGASLFDMIAITRRRRLESVRHSRLPHVTVLVYAQEGEVAITACLDSIGRSHYPQYDIVVVDNATVGSAARRAVQTYQKQHPHDAAYFYGKRKVADRLTALRAGYQKSQRGEVVCVIDGASTIEPLTLLTSAARFATAPSLQALWLHEHLQGDASLSLLLQRSMNVSQSLYDKCRSLFVKKRVYVGESGVLSRRDAFLRQSTLRGAYESIVWTTRQSGQRDMFAHLTPAHSGSMVQRSLCSVSVLYGLFLVTYFLYTAASLQSSSLLMLSWVAVSLWFAVGVWTDESATWFEKVAMSFCIPMLYFLVYSYLLIALIVVIMKTLFGVVQAFIQRVMVLSRTVTYSR